MPYIGKSPLHGNYSKLDSISSSFDGSTTQFALTTNSTAVTPVTEAALIISINGVLQEPTTAYTVSGTNITFTSAPASTDTFFGVALGEQLSGNTPSNSTVTSAKLSGNLVTPGTLDVNGQELILDADADTSITADTDDQIDIKISGADDFRFTANNFNVLSGSTLTIDSGATITNSGTASGFGSNTPSSADGQALGSSSAEWSDLYLADGGIIYFGNDQDVTLTHDPDDGLFLKSTATSDNNPVLLTLQTGETDIATDDVIGKIAFQAPDEGTGTDALLVSAAIQARSEQDFSASINKTSIDFMTGASEAATTKMTLSSAGKLEIGGELAIKAAAGVLESNANFVDQVIFGPAVDGMAWGGYWNKASLFSSLMLATVEDEGSNTEINIWDLTAQTGGTIYTTPLGTVDLASAATPTSIAACMGYIIVGSEDGIHIIDPHSGSWAERTASSWPRSLATNTAPALPDNDVQAVAAIVADAAPYDPLTGGGIPTFACTFGSGTAEASIIKDNGVVYDHTGFTVSAAGAKAIGFINDEIYFGSENTGDCIRLSTIPISAIQADDWATNNTLKKARASDNFLGCDGGSAFSHDQAVFGDSDGLSIFRDPKNTGSAQEGQTAMINRTYNTGYFTYDTRGCWLANSDTVDRVHDSTLTKQGTITEAAVATSSELKGYSGFSTSNYLYRATDSDFAPTTGDFSVAGWFKATGGGPMVIVRYGVYDTNTNSWLVQMNSDESIRFMIRDSGGTNVEVDATSTGTANYEDSTWHMFYMTCDRTSDVMYNYIDGVLKGSASTASTASITNTTQKLEIGIRDIGDDIGSPWNAGSLALIRYSPRHVNADQVKRAYEAEKGMFVDNAECLLQSGTTDAVIGVDIDPLTEKVLVTQTDAITVFKKGGLVVDSKPSVNTGASEKGRLWGALRSEQNDANTYVTAPAHDQAQVNEMVRGLSSNLPKGVDMSKAKAWITTQSHTTINAAYNVKSVVDTATGDLTINWGIPFKQDDSYCVLVGTNDGYGFGVHGTATMRPEKVQIRTRDITSTGQPTADTTLLFVVAFGELENE